MGAVACDRRGCGSVAVGHAGSSVRLFRHEIRCGGAIGADEANSVALKLTTQTALYDMGEYRIVQFKSKTIKVYNARGGEVKAMGFLKAVNGQFGFGFKTEGTNTRSLGSKIIKALNKN